jgi:hypothetical protein
MWQAVDGEARLDLSVDDDFLTNKMRKILCALIKFDRHQHAEFSSPKPI